jgi:preprotein translocase subunit SecD
MATRTTQRTTSRPSRPLAVLLLALIGLNVFVLVKEWEPRQGLDLVGGTSVILTPLGGTPSAGALSSAVDIIRERVNGTGVTSAEVVAEGQNVRVSLPSVGREQALEIVGTTAQLTFRPVLNQLPPGPTPIPTATPTPSGSPKATKTPSGSPKPSRSPTPTATANSRPLSGALLPAQASPTPSPTKKATPKATATPKRSATPTATPSAPPGIEPITIEQATEEIDCGIAEHRQKIARWFGRPEMDKEQIVSCDVDGREKLLLGPAEMTGTDVRDAEATIDTGGGSGISTGGWMITVDIKSASKWATLTETYTGQRVAIVLDGLTQSAPTIEQRIPDGTAQITGDFNEKSARQLANVLKYGALPIQFEQSQTQTISPTLGERSLEAGVLGALIGLGLVIIYSLLYYRGLGIVTVVGLGIFAALNWAMVVILGNTIGFTLTLAGIAGLIVSVGISADSYVVFYERLKDEVREGRSLRQSVDRGFTRAFRTILAANFVSFLAAATLYLLSIGEVRGFAFTLGLATLLDVVVAFLFTRPIVTLLTRTRLFREGRFVGMGDVAPHPKEA